MRTYVDTVPKTVRQPSSGAAGRSGFLLIALLFSFCMVGESFADRRVALVIGLGEYDAAPLPNAVADAVAVGNALESVGFEVHSILNEGRRDFYKRLQEFDTHLSQTRPDWLVVYYAGHGIQFDGENYLIPIDVEQDLLKPRDLRHHALGLNSLITDFFSHQTKRTFLLLDACRDPGIFANYENAGLTGTQFKIDRVHLTYLFATENGKYAYDGMNGRSPFAESIVKNINVPDQNWVQFLKAVKKSTIKLTEDFEYGAQEPVQMSSGESGEEFFFVEQNKTGSLEECERAWNSIVINSEYKKESCKIFRDNYAHCEMFREQVSRCENPALSDASGDGMYKDCRRYHRGSGGVKKDKIKAHDLCEKSVKTSGHKDAAYYLADNFYKADICGEKGSAYLKIAAEKGHRMAKRKLKKCADE